MTQFNFLVFPYRDYYFLKKFGPIVRDLHVLDALSNSPRVKSIAVINRPVSIYERMLGKIFIGSHPKLNVHWHDRTSIDIMGPLRKRKWLTHCYSEYQFDDLYDPSCCNVILDFTPLSIINYKEVGFDFIWYDLIDNFTKHNRYDDVERGFVRSKYSSIDGAVDLVTGVSKGALVGFDDAVVVSNGVGISRASFLSSAPLVAPKYDFGFVGFITDKFDCGIIERIVELGHSCVVYGDSYDKSISRRLSKIDGLTLRGKFSASETPAIMGTFKVGLIPYLRSKLHDESPLKLYQYLAYGHPVLSSAQFEVQCDYVALYENDHEFQQVCRSLIEMYDLEDSREKIPGVIADTDFWDYKVDRILDRICDRISSKSVCNNKLVI